MKALVKALLARTPYRIVRAAGANRFQAIEECLRSMQARGFSPTVVIDGGAHLGDFSTAVAAIFPQATFHLVEPQPACLPHLRLLTRERGFVLHECALADSPGEILLLDTKSPSTGAHVKLEADSETVSVRGDTLDALFADSIGPSDRVLLKLDLQGYELHALRGGLRAMRSIEAILTEVSFFAQAYEPSIAELTEFLAGQSFRLYDIAALAGRKRDNRLHQGDFVFVRDGSPLLEDSRWG